MISVKTAFPLLQVESPAAAAEFYVQHFGFESIFDTDWYVQLRNGTHEMAFIAVGHESIPSDRRAFSKNVCLTLEVEDVDSAFEEVGKVIQIVTEPRDEDWGQRHFLGYDPSGIMLDVMCMLPGVEAGD